MSAPSSEGRPSVSSTSSHTLNSRHSGTYVEDGQGSSSLRPTQDESRRNSGGYPRITQASSGGSESPLIVESIEEQDFARHRQRSRKSGGFLLNSTFSSSPGTRLPRNKAYEDDAKEKRRSRHTHGHDEERQRERLRTHTNNTPNDSPLSREVVIGRTTTEESARIGSASSQDRDDGLRVPKTRRSVHGVSPSTSGRQLENDDGPSQPTLDPNQLVHMALNLSESRRRNMSAGQLLIPQTSGSRRVTSTGIQRDGSFRNYEAGGSLRQYLNEQRRVSRNISPYGGRGSPMGLRHMSASLQRSMSMSMQGQQQEPSDATLVRRDKARAYIELKMEYLRLLELLPPLKPDATAPGNFIVTARNAPGSPHAFLSRSPSYADNKHVLGRAYNPLQHIRNRRTRARERQSLSHTPEDFQDVELVRDWVDRVEQTSLHQGFRLENGVTLPKYHVEHTADDEPKKQKRPRMGWNFTFEELLADAYWLEQGENKSVIEDRHGRKVFPPKELPKQDFLQPRASKEYPEKRRKSWVEGLPRITSDATTGDESDPTSERGRKRRILPTFRAESPKHKKHGWRGSRARSRSLSESSDSDVDSQKQGSKQPRRIVDINNNTGPLELRIKEIMEQEAMKAKRELPAIVSPDTPDKWGEGHFDIAEGAHGSSEAKETNGSVRPPSLNLKLQPRTKTDNTISFDIPKDSRSSFEDIDSTAPSTPLHPRLFPRIGSDLSPPPSRRGSIKKPKRSRFDLFRSEDSTRGHKQEPESAGSDNKSSSRQVSEEAQEGNGISTAILAAPNAVKSLLAHKKNESVSSLNYTDTHRKDHKDPKEPREPPSAVSRFFKGMKNEKSKVGDIFKRDRPVDDSDLDLASNQHDPLESDSDNDTGKSERRLRPGFNRSTTATTIGSVASKATSRYRLDLPSFRSTQHNDHDVSYASDSHISNDPVSRQARARANDRSPRFDKLAPPRMDLRSISSASTTEGSRDHSPTTARDRMKRILARPGGVGRGGLPVTPLAHPEQSESPIRQRNTSRPQLGRRHWSITDDNGNVLLSKTEVNTVTPADIARIRALFLCSGIKAREITRRAHHQRTEPAPFLSLALKSTNSAFIPVSKKEEHVLAARILVRNLEASTHALQSSTQHFRQRTIKDLTSTIGSLRSRVESELFPRVRRSGDEAVRVTSEVSGSAPLTIKQVSDEIDKLIRKRRRRMRWVRRIGWQLLEWTLLAVMWWAWLIVVILSFIRRIFGFGWGIFKWLFWL